MGIVTTVTPQAAGALDSGGMQGTPRASGQVLSDGVTDCFPLPAGKIDPAIFYNC